MRWLLFVAKTIPHSEQEFLENWAGLVVGVERKAP